MKCVFNTYNSKSMCCDDNEVILAVIDMAEIVANAYRSVEKKAMHNPFDFIYIADPDTMMVSKATFKIG